MKLNLKTNAEPTNNNKPNNQNLLKQKLGSLKEVFPYLRGFWTHGSLGVFLSAHI